MVNPSKFSHALAKAFSSVRGALKRSNLSELRCKKIWLDRCLRDFPGTDIAAEATRLLPAVVKAIEKVEVDISDHSLDHSGVGV